MDREEELDPNEVDGHVWDYNDEEDRKRERINLLSFFDIKITSSGEFKQSHKLAISTLIDAARQLTSTRRFTEYFVLQ